MVAGHMMLMRVVLSNAMEKTLKPVTHTTSLKPATANSALLVLLTNPLLTSRATSTTLKALSPPF